MIEPFSRRWLEKSHARVLIFSPHDRLSLTRSLAKSGFVPQIEKDPAVWGNVLMGGNPPDAWLISAEVIDDALVFLAQELAAMNLLMPTAILFERPEAGLVERAWPLAQVGARAVFTEISAVGLLNELLKSDTSQVINHLLMKSQTKCVVLERMFFVLSHDPRALSMTPQALAEHIAMTKSQLYRALRQNALPGIEHLQLLLRLFPALRLLQRSGDAGRAAKLAGFADSTTFRRAIGPVSA